MEKSCLGTTALVDEIISDALQKMESGDLLPASEASSMSILLGGPPRARSTSITHIPGLRGYRSFTDDVLKSFVDRDGCNGTTALLESGCGGSSSEQNDENSDPFEGVSRNQQLESSGQFVAAEKLLNEFDEDEKRCRDENLFKENRPVPIECASIAESPVKLFKKQVSPPDWAKKPAQLDSLSYFTSQPGSSTFVEEASVSNSEGSTLSTIQSNLFDKSEVSARPSYNPGLPYSLGMVLAGVSTPFELPPPLTSTCSATPSIVVTKCCLNGKQMPLCKAALTAQRLKVVISPPAGVRGEITVSIDVAPSTSVALTAFCIAPAFRLPTRITVPVDVRSVVPLRVESPLLTSMKLELRSDLLTTRQITLTPDTESIPLEVAATPAGEYPLNVTLLFRQQEVATLRSVLDVRRLRISIRSVSEDPNSSIVITNSESFPVDVKLSDDAGCLRYSSRITLNEGQNVVKSTESFCMPAGQPERYVNFRLDLLSPIEAPLPGRCAHRFPSSLPELRPNLSRFLWLLDDEVEFSMVEHTSGKPSAWRKHVFISPCPMIERYIKVVEEPNDPSKVVLKITRPPQLVLGRLRFYLRGPDGKPDDMPYGFRYPFIVPQKPQLRWHTVAESAATNVYQIPIDGKLKVTNTIAHDVFVVTPDDGFIITGGQSVEFSISKPCRIFYGLEAWRQIVKLKTRRFLREIKDNHRDSMDPSRVLADYPKQQGSGPFIEKKLLDMIPDDLQAALRLYKLFEGTVDSVELRHVAENGTFFAR